MRDLCQGYEWGLAVHQVSRSIRLDPSEVKWRTQRHQRPWLAGTVIEHMCALVDVTALAELIASGAVKHMHDAAKPKHIDTTNEGPCFARPHDRIDRQSGN